MPTCPSCCPSCVNEKEDRDDCYSSAPGIMCGNICLNYEAPVSPEVFEAVIAMVKGMLHGVSIYPYTLSYHEEGKLREMVGECLKRYNADFAWIAERTTTAVERFPKSGGNHTERFLGELRKKLLPTVTA